MAWCFFYVMEEVVCHTSATWTGSRESAPQIDEVFGAVFENGPEVQAKELRTGTYYNSNLNLI